VTWDADALVNESAAQRNWRLRPRPHDGSTAQQISQRLRVLGARLDAQGGGPYVIVVGADAIRAQGPDGYEHTFQPADLRYARS
jgi:hypothetical protein